VNEAFAFAKAPLAVEYAIFAIKLGVFAWRNPELA
jgi:hypothetical protein